MSKKNCYFSPLFVLLFICYFFILEYLYFLSQDTPFKTLLIDKFTVSASVFFINTFTNIQAIADGAKIISSNIRLSVLNGCDGIDTMIILLSAVLAYRTKYRAKLTGVIIGLLMLYSLNQIRIISLFIILPYNKPWFHAIHNYIGPTLIILLTLIYFYIWSRFANNRANAKPH